MKKFNAIVCTLFFVALAAQVQAAAKWGAGVKGGVNLGDVSGDDAPDDTNMRTGFIGGAFAQADFTEEIGARLEALYVMKGAETDSAGVESKLKLDYIEIPVLFVVNFEAGEKAGFNIFAGPTFAFKVGAEVEEGGVTVDLDDEIKGFEFGAAFGAGFAYQLNSASIILDARYSLGATTVAEEVGGSEPDLKTRGIGIMAGVSFPLGGGAE
jgi:hypothetical protein